MKDSLKGTNIYLIGMMGTGKTTIGREIAHQLGYQFFDTDAVIEQATRQTIADLFAEQGEAAFRDLETQVLSQLSAYKCLVIATGGGIVLRQANWSYLRHGIVVWLDAPIPVLQQRLETDTTRPLLQTADLLARLSDLMEQRRSLYAQADLQIQSDNQVSPAQLATQTLERIQQILKPEILPPDYGN
ncbi:shikimate kinase [Leptodesmis sichuanensis]|uniref:shikimate kinase n=1 Tax=Leptodesmis sichuanensis TaxID=2906798 RepID=UPI001F1ECAF4|nr:shikimate kinase [Leptodesmis sichuanensis]